MRTRVKRSIKIAPVSAKPEISLSPFLRRPPITPNLWELQCICYRRSRRHLQAKGEIALPFLPHPPAGSKRKWNYWHPLHVRGDGLEGYLAIAFFPLSWEPAVACRVGSVRPGGCKLGIPSGRERFCGQFLQRREGRIGSIFTRIVQFYDAIHTFGSQKAQI